MVATVVACHPTLSVVAIGGADDTVLLYDLARGGWSLPRLSHASQHLVSCAEWEPTQPTSLALGCASGVCLWAIAFAHEQTPQQQQPAAAGGGGGPSVTGAHLVRFLSHASGAPASSIAWSPYGGQLATASRTHGGVRVWDARTGLGEDLPFKSAGGCAAVSWAPGAGAHVCALGLDGSVRLWEALSWRWETLRPQPTARRSGAGCDGASGGAPAFSSAVWSPDGRALLLVPTRGLFLHYVLLRDSPPAIRALDGGAHAPSIAPPTWLPAEAAADGAGAEGPVELPALALRPVGDAARHALARGWDGVRAHVERTLAAAAAGARGTVSGAAGGQPTLAPLPGLPEGYALVATFTDERAREHAAAALAPAGANGAVASTGWELTRCSCFCAISRVEWDARTERIVLCTRQELCFEQSQTPVRHATPPAALVGARSAHVLHARLEPALQLTALGEVPSAQPEVRVRVPSGGGGARSEKDGAFAAGPDVVSFARAPGGRPVLVVMWADSGELACVPAV